MLAFEQCHTEGKTRDFQPLDVQRCAKTGGTQPKLSAACFTANPCPADTGQELRLMKTLKRRKQYIVFLY
ncbi:MAG: hypothetical protein KHX25_10060 [Firmicutes bacterium]|nr:hypothetical protein [Bacillota bacterium]